MSIRTFAANAYRTLGLSGSATQSQIVAAARRMKIWPDPTQIPPTPWDSPKLGPIVRGKNEVEQALARLRHPQTRLEDRLTWYAGAPVDDVLLASQREGDTIAESHDAAVAALHLAFADDVNDADVRRWELAMRRLTELSALPGYADWLLATEMSGGFDIRTDSFEVGTAVSAIRLVLASSLAPRAEAALVRGDSKTCAALLAVLRQAGPESADAETDLLDRAEDTLTTQIQNWDERLREALRTNVDYPEPFFAKNYAFAKVAEESYRKLIVPALDALLAMVGPDAAHQDPGARIARASSQCAELLALMSRGYEWGGRFTKAQELLREGMRLSAGTSTAARLERELDRLTAASLGWSHGKAHAAAKRLKVARPTSDEGSGAGRLAWVVIFVILGAVRACFTTETSRPSYSPPPMPQLPSGTADFYKHLRERQNAGKQWRTEQPDPETEPGDRLDDPEPIRRGLPDPPSTPTPPIRPDLGWRKPTSPTQSPPLSDLPPSTEKQ